MDLVSTINKKLINIFKPLQLKFGFIVDKIVKARDWLLKHKIILGILFITTFSLITIVTYFRTRQKRDEIYFKESRLVVKSNHYNP